MDEAKLREFLERWTHPNQEEAYQQWKSELEAIGLA